MWPSLRVCLSDFGAAAATIVTSGDVYEYVDVPLDWWHANRHCEQRFAQLLFEIRDSELASVSKLLRSHQGQSSVWLDEREAFLHKHKQRREYKMGIGATSLA